MKHKNVNTSFINTALKNGEPKAFEVLFDKHYKSLFAFINFYTNDEDLSKDIIQETFVKLWSKRETIKEDMSIIAFLHRIAYNIFVDNYRKSKREKASLDTFAYDRLMMLAEEDNTETQKRITKVKQAIEELPPRCKEVFEMSKFRGYKYAEIAETLNISIKTVEVQMGKAFSYIRNKFK